MNRRIGLVLGIVLLVGSLAEAGCSETETKSYDAGSGGGSPTVGDALPVAGIANLVPKSNEISQWTIDPSQRLTASVPAATASHAVEAEALIDGSAAAFFTQPFTANLAWQNYIKQGVYTVDLHLWEMPTAAQAKDIYSVLVNQYPLYLNNTWTPINGLGDEARICNTGTTWWINTYKGKYFVEVNLNKLPNGSEESDTTGREEVKAFATELMQRL